MLPHYGSLLLHELASPYTKGVCLQQVQAHVAQTDIDPGAAAAWLHVTEAGMEASPAATQLIRSAHPGLLLMSHPLGCTTRNPLLTISNVVSWLGGR